MMKNILTSVTLCLSTRNSARITQKPHGQLHQCFARVACDRVTILLWRRCDMLRTSGFLDDVTVSHSGPAVRRVHS